MMMAEVVLGPVLEDWEVTAAIPRCRKPLTVPMQTLEWNTMKFCAAAARVLPAEAEQPALVV
jgi:hypothetical protein